MLTDQSFTRVGGQRMVKVDVRVVSSTSRELAEEIAEGRFREDLYYRLNVVPGARCRRWPSGARTSQSSSTISPRATPPSAGVPTPEFTRRGDRRAAGL